MDHFQLNLVPAELLHFIVEKTDAKEFLKLRRTCKFLYKFCEPLEKSVCCEATDIRFVNNGSVFITHGNTTYTVISGPLYFEMETEHDCEELESKLSSFKLKCKQLKIDFPWKPCTDQEIENVLKIAKKYKITVESLAVEANLTCTQKKLKEMLEYTKPSYLLVSTAIKKEHISPETFEKIGTVFLGQTDYGNEEILQLRPKEVFGVFDHVSNEGLNLFLQQWLSGEREIARIIFNETRTPDDSAIFNKLPHSLLYNKDVHALSVLSARETTTMIDSILHRRFYVLIKSHDLESKLVVAIDKYSVEMSYCTNPAEYFTIYTN